MELDAKAIETCFEEFDPYLCNVIMSKILKKAFLNDKSKFVNLIKGEFLKDPKFVCACTANVLQPINSLKIQEPAVIKRIRDINLLYTMKFAFYPNLKVEGKVTGRALELVVESILKWKLKNNQKIDYEFVDWRGFDFLITDKEKNDWIVGIQCKTAYDRGGFLGYKQAIQEMSDFSKSFETGKKFIMLCGCAIKSQKDLIRQAFEKINWEFYYLWTDKNSYGIDPSFYKFIDAVEKISRT